MTQKWLTHRNGHTCVLFLKRLQRKKVYGANNQKLAGHGKINLKLTKCKLSFKVHLFSHKIIFQS